MYEPELTPAEEARGRRNTWLLVAMVLGLPVFGVVLVVLAAFVGNVASTLLDPVVAVIVVAIIAAGAVAGLVARRSSSA